MRKSLFFGHWPIFASILAVVISNIVLVAFISVQAIDAAPVEALQSTPTAQPVPQQTAVIADTGGGGERVFYAIFSSWFFWVFMGMVLLYFLFLMMAQSGSNHPSPEKIKKQDP